MYDQMLMVATPLLPTRGLRQLDAQEHDRPAGALPASGVRYE